MPIDKYFKGSGDKVMNSLKDEYGDKKGTSVFYALANKHPKMKPKSEKASSGAIKRLSRG